MPSTQPVRYNAGLLMLLDEPHSINISSYEQKVTLERPSCGARGRSCDFVQLPNPYSSMWLLSRERLRHFIATPYWRCDGTLSLMWSCMHPTHVQHRRHPCAPAPGPVHDKAVQSTGLDTSRSLTVSRRAGIVRLRRYHSSRAKLVTSLAAVY